MQSTIERDPQTSFESGDQAAPRPPNIFCLVAGVFIIAFVVGSAVTEFHWFPYPQYLRPSYTAARALHSRIALTSSLRETDLWHTPRFEHRGVVRHNREKCFAGYTLYTSGHDSAAFLIDMQGRLVHRWHVPFHTLWNRPPHIDRLVPEPFIHWRRGQLCPNGDLIALCEAAGDTPWGYGLVKVDRDSKVLWKVAEHIHHDLYVRPDDSIITLSHDWRNTDDHPVSGAPHLSHVLLDDFVLVISPEGNVLRRISLLDAIANSDFADLLTTVANGEWDLLHTNTVEAITPEFASQYEFAEAGQIMLSFRARHALAILDLKTERLVWASSGPYHSQHDPDVLSSGRILLFDNRGHLGLEGPSRVIELDPISQTIHWSYAGTAENPLYSLVRSVQQLLPNDNVLITESDAGRILEVTRGGQVVWEFRNPASLDSGPASIPIVCGAIRLPPDRIRFKLNNGATPGRP